MLLHPSFAINDAGHLTIGSLDAVELSKTYGTPAYYLDLDAVRAQCRRYRAAFRTHFGEDASPIFAGKSLCFRKLYRVMAEERMCADCVSSGELYTAHGAGFPMERVFFHGNNKTDADLQYAVELGVGHIVVDGLDELYALASIAAKKQKQVPILLRITPGIDPHTHKKISTGNVDSKFGMAILTGQALSFVREALSMAYLTVEGFHCHIGSQIFSVEPFADAAQIMLAFVRKIYDKTGYMAKVLNLGGGFGVRYVADDPVFDTMDCIRQLGEEIHAMCRTLSIPHDIYGAGPEYRCRCRCYGLHGRIGQGNPWLSELRFRRRWNARQSALHVIRLPLHSGTRGKSKCSGGFSLHTRRTVL